MKNVRHVVLDEADCLLDDSFSSLLLHFFKRLNVSSERNLKLLP